LEFFLQEEDTQERVKDSQYTTEEGETLQKKKKNYTQYKLSFINRDRRDPYDTLKIPVFWFIKGASHWCNTAFVCENLSNDSFKLNN